MINPRIRIYFNHYNSNKKYKYDHHRNEHLQGYVQELERLSALRVLLFGTNVHVLCQQHISFSIQIYQHFSFVAEMFGSAGQTTAIIMLHMFQARNGKKREH